MAGAQQSRPFRRVRVAAAAAALAAALTPVPARADASDSPLVAAVRAGDVEAVRRLATRPAIVNQSAPDGTTPLHWAALGNQVGVVRALLAAGATPNVATRTGATPLGLAALNGGAGVVEALLAAGVDPNVPLRGGQTALMTAARAGSLEAVRALLERGARVDAKEPSLGETAMIWAAAENHGDVIRLLVRHGADVNGRSNALKFPAREFGDGKSGRLTVLPAGAWTPLMYAARQNATEAVEALVEARANLDLTDPDGTTALLIAVINAHFDLAALLVEKGANPNVGDASGMGPLYAAVDLNSFPDTPGRPAPVPSGRLDAPAMVEVLLERGADPNAPLRSPILVRVHDGGDPALGAGATPLLRAARKSDVELMRLLLGHGADPGRAMANGGTALMLVSGLGGAGRFTPYEARQATEADRLDAITLLLDRGADVNAVERSGQSALHFAAAERGDDVVRRLVERGARPDVKDGSGRTPLDVAMGGGGAGRRPAAARPGTASLLRTLMAPR